MGLPEIAGLAEKDAAVYVSYYWGGAMVGRFIGSAVMQKVPGGTVLAFNALAAVVLILVAVFTSGPLAMWAILAVGLCNSVMFPTIFSLAVTGLGRHTSQGSSILCMAIVGGALIPLAQGALADSLGLQLSFLLPILCYLYIAFYGLKGHKNIHAS
jgi:FHS family L-fucose permease-like MFS transporter